MASSPPPRDTSTRFGPAEGPRVRITPARPSASVGTCSTVNRPLKLPSPAVTVKVTAASGRRSPYWSRTSTTRGRASTVPGACCWPSPETISSAEGTGSLATPVAVKITGSRRLTGARTVCPSTVAPTVWAPGCGPRVRVVAARPSLSVVAVLEERVPAPAVTEKTTTTPA